MPHRSRDWFEQSKRDLEQAKSSKRRDTYPICKWSSGRCTVSSGNDRVYGKRVAEAEK
jgi:hypothetical protein